MRQRQAPVIYSSGFMYQLYVQKPCLEIIVFFACEMSRHESFSF